MASVSKTKIIQKPALAISALQRSHEKELWDALPKYIIQKMKSDWSTGFIISKLAGHIAQGIAAFGDLQEVHIELWKKVVNDLVTYDLTNPSDWLELAIPSYGKRLKEEIGRMAVGCCIPPYSLDERSLERCLGAEVFSPVRILHWEILRGRVDREIKGC